MTIVILLGHHRRITLDELYDIAHGDATLDFRSTTSEEIVYVTTWVEEAMETLSQKVVVDDVTELLLTVPQTLASLSLLGLVFSQGRFLDDENETIEVTKTMIELINTMKTLQPNKQLQLPITPTLYSTTLLKILPTSIQTILTPILLLQPSSSYSFLNRIISLSIGVLSLSEIKYYNQTTDAIGSLSAERCRIDPSLYYSDAMFGDGGGRCHKGCAESASVLRCILEGSKFAVSKSAQKGKKKKKKKKGGKNQEEEEEEEKEKLEGMNEMERKRYEATCDMPQYHGPASDCILNSCKTMEVEMNCFESKVDVKLDGTVACLALIQAKNAAERLVRGSKDRVAGLVEDSGEEEGGGGVAVPSFDDLMGISQSLAKTSSTLKRSLETEAKLNVEFVMKELKEAEEIAKKKEAEKAARAAEISKKNKSNNNNNNVDEFAGMTEAQKSKILRKRAEKEAKAAAKKAKSTSSTSSTSSSSPTSTIFGMGTTSISTHLTPTPNLTSPLIQTLQNQIIKPLLSGGIQRKPKIPKGTRDYLPDEMSIRSQAFSIIRRVFTSHGAVEIDTPVFELKDTLTGKYGEDSKLIYDLADQGGEMLALRYDLTVPFARFLSLHSVGNIKRFHIGKVYRRDQPALKRGRYREFYQCDFDIAGVYGRMIPDAECVCVCADILDALPIGDFGIKLNHRRLLDAILDICGVPQEKFRMICSAVDKLDKEVWEEVRREMVEDKGLEGSVADRIGDFVVLKGEPWEMYNKLKEGGKFGDHVAANEALEDLRIMFQYLEAMGRLKFVSFDLSLARGLDYYTGVIYEAVCMSGNTQVGSIGGGGRYDNLVSMFQEAGKVTPCVGVSVGIERVFTLMENRLREEQGSIKQPNVNILVASIGGGTTMITERMKLSKLLWDASISAEFSQKDNPKLKHEIENALERGIPLMVIVGEEELNMGKVKVKDLNEREEVLVDVGDLVGFLRKEKGVIPVGCEFASEIMMKD